MEKKHTISEVNDIVESEGLGYAIQHYMSGDHIKNKVLAEKWDECAKLLNEIEEILQQ